MIINSMPVFLITINLTDFQCFLVIHLAKVELNLDKKTKSAFMQITLAMNPIVIAKFFYIICKALFISLLTIGKVKRCLLEPIINYFAINETNWGQMLYLHYLI